MSGKKQPLNGSGFTGPEFAKLAKYLFVPPKRPGPRPVSKYDEAFIRRTKGERLSKIMKDLEPDAYTADPLGTTQRYSAAISGLYRYDPDGRARHYTVRDGLPENAIHSLLAAPDGRLWIGTGTGLGLTPSRPGEGQRLVERVYAIRPMTSCPHAERRSGRTKPARAREGMVMVQGRHLIVKSRSLPVI